ncbi:MAG: hypothetical protein COV80_04030 [Parcubacteria group bacterium CG11_big_fil_rev_8_21_14_0_20_48_46]|nr:MAG: hypothetical protein COZ99_00140 [Parcubacteria group bacterium CG_4_8_14_3_um_filter_48_16]PIY77832.1 MAG: hypothetical protein COY83_03080 [Parcubacteria group bacterium CG_4_10_14_0_8_um_filter_48_154]PIZ78138.1 MAG: hypothetical protein COY03_00240 [bacterium CG_4_10_14_0_2_um_filter_48_144]PJC39625.1 MAG: hypothetical protein CO043_03215 [Parcubacteria group bacterium CG_4_9_14_0_2_um_filter_48_40]PJE52457.1 MAG: hypothetical protein COV80_04030 [Parcubacteria group bacterium CG11_
MNSFAYLIDRLRQETTLALLVRVIPNAHTTAFREALEDGSFKIAVAAPPEKGKANKELIIFLSGFFGVSRSSVELVYGHASRVKKVIISL